MKAYAKAIAALLGAVGTWGVTATQEGGIDSGEWFGLLLALAAAVAVYAIPNEEQAKKEAGHFDLGVIANVLLVIFLVLAIGRLLGWW